MSKVWYPVVFIAAAALAVGAGLGLSYSGGYSPPPEVESAIEKIDLRPYELAAAPVLDDDRTGTLVVDTIHFNFFLEGELDPLLSQVSRLGYDIDFFGDRLALQLLNDQFERAALMEEALRGADSLLVVSPILEYGASEADVVRRFVDKGGRLLVLAEPTRFHLTNSLVTPLGINFETDFLYNVDIPGANYRNVRFSGSPLHPVTDGLGSVVLYTAASISGEAQPLLAGGPSTHSSRREGAGDLTPMVSVRDGRVLAIGDSTFMKPPFDQVEDNGAFVARIADFLTTSERTFDLADFPAPLARDVVVSMLSPGLLGPATQLTSLLTSGGRLAGLDTLDRPGLDTVFVGLFADRAAVDQHLRAGGVTFADGRILTAFAPPVRQTNGGLLLLDSRGGRNVLVIMASSEREVDLMVRLLATGAYRSGLVSPMLGLYDFS